MNVIEWHQEFPNNRCQISFDLSLLAFVTFCPSKKFESKDCPPHVSVKSLRQFTPEVAKLRNTCTLVNYDAIVVGEIWNICDQIDEFVFDKLLSLVLSRTVQSFLIFCAYIILIKQNAFSDLKLVSTNPSSNAFIRNTRTSVTMYTTTISKNHLILKERIT